MYTDDLLKIYADSFRKNWELLALTDYVGRNTMSYGDLARHIAMVHLLFKGAGIKPGDKIALMGKNTIQWVEVFMATLTYGAVIVLVLQDFNPIDATHILNHSGSKMLFIDDSIMEHLEFEEMPELRAAISLNTRKLLGEHPANRRIVEKMLTALPMLFRKRYPNGFRPEDISYPSLPQDALAEINYTSGTTGFSKGVMLTLGNLWGNVSFGVDSRLYKPSSRCLSFLPLAHCYGCAFDLLTPLASGAHITLLGKLPTPKLLLKALSEVKPCLILLVPLILEKIYKKQLQPILGKLSVRAVLKVPGLSRVIYGKIRDKLVEAFGGEFQQIIVGGAPLNHEVEEFLHRIKFPFTVGYGMTECGPLISYTPWDEFKVGSSGMVLHGLMEVKVTSEHPAKVPGEVCVRGQNVMKGYYKNPEATEAAIDAEGWLHTGDMGTVDPDGTIYLKGRYKTMILSATGQNIYPEEIEAKLNNLPYVGESLVVERGRSLVALVYPDYEAMDRDKLTSSDLPAIMEQNRVALNKQVAAYERIDKVQLIANEFEKTPKKSIKRYLYNA